MALLAVTKNLFPDDLYKRKGGRGRVKDCVLISFEMFLSCMC